MELSNPIFNDADAARRFLEAERWPNGPVCPHCGNVDQASIRALQGKKHRDGLYQCNDCREQFTVTIGTVFERSKISLDKWLLASFLISSSKKGISAHQLYRMLNFGSYRTAWFMCHRIREAMRSGDLSPMGGSGATVEIDETFIGLKDGVKKGKASYWHKNTVLSLVERGGSVRSFHVESARKADVLPIIKANLQRETSVMTDEAAQYIKLRDHFAKHQAVDHSRKEYGYTDFVSGDNVNTNTIEGFYSIFKRGMKGVYQHCGEQHLHRYLAEFDFRYNHRVALGVDDMGRTVRLLKGAIGKRLQYQRPAH